MLCALILHTRRKIFMGNQVYSALINLIKLSIDIENKKCNDCRYLYVILIILLVLISHLYKWH